MTNTAKQMEYEHLLNCLARKINSMNKTRQAEFGGMLKKHHNAEFIDDLKRRMKNEKT